MKRLIHCLFFISIFSPALAQSKAAVDTGKYRINLPDYWKPGNKVWEILTDKLPVVADELKDKDICGDNCKPKYTVEFHMSEPEILDYHSNRLTTSNGIESWEIVTLYSFSSSLLLFDNTDKLLTRFILVDTNEVWRVREKIQLEGYKPRPPMPVYMLRPSYNQGTGAADRARNYNSRPGGGASTGTSPYSYINENKEKLSPTTRDMINVVDGKIRSW